MSRRSHADKESGFTLLEVLIALVIFAVGILGAASMQISSIQGNSHGRQVSEASGILSDRIETLITLDYDDPALEDVDGDGTDQDLNGDGVDDDGGNFGLDDLANPDSGPINVGNYVIWWNIAVNHPLRDTKTIRVIVDPPGRAQRFSIDMVKARYANQ